MRALLVLAMLGLAGCASSRTVEVVTKAAPAPQAPLHYRIASIDERANEVVLEPATIEVVDVDGEKTEIVRVSGKEPLVLPFSHFALILEEGGHDVIEVEKGNFLDAVYGPSGQLMELRLR